MLPSPACAAPRKWKPTTPSPMTPRPAWIWSSCTCVTSSSPRMPEEPLAPSDLRRCDGLLEHLQRTPLEALPRAATMCGDCIAAEGLVHLFGSGHSRMAVEEIFPRYGSFPGFHPIVELSLTFHNPVVGANGQRQAMFIE